MASTDSVEPELLSLAVAAKKLGISETFARELVRQENFPAVVVPLGRRKLVSRASLQKYLDSLAARPVQAARSQGSAGGVAGRG